MPKRGSEISCDACNKIDVTEVQWSIRIDATVVESSKIQDKAGEKNRSEAQLGGVRMLNWLVDVSMGLTHLKRL